MSLSLSLKFRKVGKTEIYDVRKEGVCYRHASSRSSRRSTVREATCGSNRSSCRARGASLRCERRYRYGYGCQKKMFAGAESCVPREAEDRLTVEAIHPIRRPNCACRVRKGWQEVRSVRCHSRQRCNICAMCSARHCCQHTEDEELQSHTENNRTRNRSGPCMWCVPACGGCACFEHLWTSPKNGEAKIQALPTLTPLGTRR